MKNDLCICGHEREHHFKLSGADICGFCLNTSNGNIRHKFKLDNLKYLEQKYEEKHK